jgi:Kef-type K+ transport system membrane component KefB/mannitol/fructose-specific phosphotransferase system IIA component (Ntr-type)
MPTALPISDPVLIFALAMAIFLAGPVLFERLKIPGIIGLIVLGTIVGPNVLHLLDRDFTFELLGQVGLLYLVFLAGLELDLNRFQERRTQSIVFGLLSFAFPMGLSILVMPLLGFGMPAAVLIGAIVGSHTLLAYPVVSRLGILKNRAMVTVIGGTLVTDTLALTVLAVVGGTLDGTPDAMYWLQLFGRLALYAAVVLIAVPRVGRWFFRNVPSQAPAEFLFLMVVLFGTAWAAELAGAQPIIGAFLAGLTLNRLIPLVSPLMTRVRFVGNALFIPFFLLSVGMLVDPRVLLAASDVWILAGALTGLVLVGKFAGSLAGMLLFRHSIAEGMAMYGLSVPQAAATLAVTFVGLEMGLFGEALVNAVIVMIVITVFIGPWLVDRFGREIAMQEERKPYDPSDAPQRILIPISNPATADGLMDIAFLLRGDRAEEPLYPLMVVQDSDDGAEAQVAEAEKMLSHAVLYAAGADVPVSPLTRVDRNIASGIARAMADTRTSAVVVGWDGTQSGGSRTAVFGTVLDQLLEQTKQLVLVAKLGHPLNTTDRLIVVLPPATDRHPGFLQAVGAMKTLAAQLDASIEVLVVGEDPSRYARPLKEAKPDIPVEVEAVEGWGPLIWELRARLVPRDLVVVISARRGTVSWHRELERLPGQLSSLAPESFIVAYPSEVEAGATGSESPHEFIPAALTPGRVVFDLEGDTHREVMRHLLSTHFANTPNRMDRVLDRLVEGEEKFSSEIRKGIALPHTLVSGLDEPLMFFGISPEGVQFPNSEAPVHLVLILLGSPEKRHDHLHLLNRMAGILRKAENLDELLAVRGLEELYGWFSAQRTAEARRSSRKA